MLNFLLVFNLFIITHISSIYLLSIINGIRVEKFYIWWDTWKALVKFKIKNTEFGFGWLPIGGYVKLSGTLTHEEQDHNLNDYDYDSKSPIQRLSIMFIASFVSLFIGLASHFTHYRFDVHNFNWPYYAFATLFILLFFFFKATKNKNSTPKDLVFSKSLNRKAYIAAYLIHFSWLILIGILLNDLIGISYIEGLPKNIIKNHSETSFLVAKLGFILFFINLLPFAGMNGFNIVNIYYEIITKERVPYYFLDKISIRTFPLSYIVYGFVIYKYFWL